MQSLIDYNCQWSHCWARFQTDMMPLQRSVQIQHDFCCWSWSTRGPFYIHGLILIQAWISNHMSGKVWDKISYPLPNFKYCTAEVWERMSNFIPNFIMDYLSISGLKLIHVSKWGPGCQSTCGGNVDKYQPSVTATQHLFYKWIYSVIAEGRLFLHA